MSRPNYGGGGQIQQQDMNKEDGEKKRKVGTRRTVDYGCTNEIWCLERLAERSKRFDEKWMRPALNEIINVFANFICSVNDRCCLQLHMKIILLHHWRLNTYIHLRTKLSIPLMSSR